MIDFHSHILPKMDDGSKSVEESLEMMLAYYHQNIGTVVATPHFYREKESIDSFLERRQYAYLKLRQRLAYEINLPNILLAAEVCFYNGISRDEKVEKLFIGNSRLLLLEMPFCKWDQGIMGEVRSLITINNIDVIIAHAERYLKCQNKIRDLLELINMGAVMQINTSNFRKRLFAKTVYDLLRIGNFFILGSDCHNMSDRSPDIKFASEAIALKLGNSHLKQIENLSESLIYCNSNEIFLQYQSNNQN